MTGCPWNGTPDSLATFVPCTRPFANSLKWFTTPYMWFTNERVDLRARKFWRLIGDTSTGTVHFQMHYDWGKISRLVYCSHSERLLSLLMEKSLMMCSMYYHFGILLLFRPFLKLVLLRSAVSPREICTQAAENISSLLRSYRNLYTLRCTPSFVPYIVLASGIIHLVNANTVLGSAYCDKAVKDLTDLSVCHSFAKRSVKILLSLAHRWRVSIAHGPWDSEDPKANPIRDLDTLPSSMDFFTLDPEEALPTFEETSVRSSRTRPLFSLFAKQGLPPIFFSDDLRLSGRDDTNTGRSTESQLALGGFDIATSSNAISFNQGGFPTQERDEDDDDNMWMD